MASVFSASDRRKLGDWNIGFHDAVFYRFAMPAATPGSWMGWNMLEPLKLWKENKYLGFKIGRLELVCMMTIDYRFLLSSPQKKPWSSPFSH